MSKASEYAAKRPPVFQAPGVQADVMADGSVGLDFASWPQTHRLSPESALALGRWLVDTFADRPDLRPLCPYCGTDDHLAGSPASDRCRERSKVKA